MTSLTFSPDEIHGFSNRRQTFTYSDVLKVHNFLTFDRNGMGQGIWRNVVHDEAKWKKAACDIAKYMIL